MERYSTSEEKSKDWRKVRKILDFVQQKCCSPFDCLTSKLGTTDSKEMWFKILFAFVLHILGMGLPGGLMI